MIEAVADASAATRAQFDALIDVRSPVEFAEDHVPGAINLPVLSDAERAEVGRIYVQQSKFLARRIGAALVSRNIADHLMGPLADQPGGYHPLIYCWRGGQRSTAMATVLSQVGWRVGLLAGGYKTYRRGVTARLYSETAGPKLVVLAGPTGSGKTAILPRLEQRGVQVLDLEGMAAHRGSLFGAHGARPQPPQKRFESELLRRLDALDPARWTVVEAESSRIGQLFLPPLLWTAMQAAPRATVTAPAAARARFIAESYTAGGADTERLLAAIRSLPNYHSRADKAAWLAATARGDYETAALALIEAHYDPAYRQATRPAPQGFPPIVLPDVSPASLDQAADQIAALVSSLGEAGLQARSA